MPPRRIRVGQAPQTPRVISDAEYEPGSGRQPRVGWVLTRVGDQPPFGQTLVLEQYIAETWRKRTQQILLWPGLDCRIWIEWIDTIANPAEVSADEGCWMNGRAPKAGTFQNVGIHLGTETRMDQIAYSMS